MPNRHCLWCCWRCCWCCCLWCFYCWCCCWADELISRWAYKLILDQELHHRPSDCHFFIFYMCVTFKFAANLRREMFQEKYVSAFFGVCVCASPKESIIYGSGIIVTIKREVNIFMDFFMAHFNCIQLFLMSGVAWRKSHSAFEVVTNIVNRENANWS